MVDDFAVNNYDLHFHRIFQFRRLDDVLFKRISHKVFYGGLRELGFKAYHAKHVYSYIKATVKSTLLRGGTTESRF